MSQGVVPIGGMDDDHRAYLQGFISGKILSAADVEKLVNNVNHICNVSNPPDWRDSSLALTRTVNHHLSSLGFKIAKVVDECDRRKRTFYALVATSSAKHPEEVAKRAMEAEFPNKQMEFVKLVIDYLCEAEDDVDESKLLNLVHSDGITTKFTTTEAQAILRKLESNRWLDRKERGVCFSPRAQEELKTYLKDRLGDADHTCVVCRAWSHRVTRCPSCDKPYHLYCWAGLKDACKECGEPINRKRRHAED